MKRGKRESIREKEAPLSLPSVYGWNRKYGFHSSMTVTRKKGKVEGKKKGELENLSWAK